MFLGPLTVAVSVFFSSAYAAGMLRVGHEAEVVCLAENIYWEGRSEPPEGQRAIAYVVLNRMAHPAFPNTVCDVVRGGGERSRGECQFSWWCDGLSDAIKDQEAWRRALITARSVLNSSDGDPTNGAVFYHATTVTPEWTKERHIVARIGSHLYYR